jgi:hypothetical protein
MKDQYVGDINDYVKYSVLRAILDTSSPSLLVSWMLTSDDARKDGLKTSYLSKPDDYRGVDPDLFDALRTIVVRGKRSTREIAASRALPGAEFYADLLEDRPGARERFMLGLWRAAQGHEVVFFDPDNGLDVRSVPAGRAGSRRYVYCSELTPLSDLNAAAVIYQHFPRVRRRPYLRAQLDRLEAALPGYETFAISSSHVAFLVATPPTHTDRLSAGLRLAARRWEGRLTLIGVRDNAA